MMKDKVLDTITTHGMLHPGDAVTVALSGGADSMALLSVMCALAERLSVSVSAMHINHCIRGAESDSDEEFCRRSCADMGVPFSAVRVDVPAHVKATGLSTEEAARELRYEALFGCDGLIATAHNMCDNAETVLFNITRGTGIRGICGIPYVRGRIIRPLLDVSREEIEAYLAEKGLSYVTDSTNLSDD